MGGRMALAAACLLGLAGCNRVVSMDPWFTAADAGGVPKFRDGLWASYEADCRVDVEKPAEQWPDCAGASFQRGGESLQMTWEDPDGDGPLGRSFAGWKSIGDAEVIANGDPLIGQLELGSDAPEGSAEDSADDEPQWRYMYFAGRPTLDERGEIVAMETWPVSCGPLPEPKRGKRSDDEEPVADVTDRPFPGLTVVEDNCTAESVEALRRAATLSEPLEPHGTTRWVRDGWR